MEYSDVNKRIPATGEEFIRTKIAGSARGIDEEEKFPLDNFQEMGSHNLLGIPYPEEYGGLGLDYAAYTSLIRELARVCASTAMTVVAHSTLTCKPIFCFGSEDLKKRYLNSLLTGSKVGAFALTEPNAGSDISALETRAVEFADYYLVNGSKTFITNANVADVFCVAVKTAPEKKVMGISLLVLEKEMQGVFTSGKTIKKMGMRGSDTGELIFDNVKVPKTNLIGRKNFGFQILHQTLVDARLGMAAIAVGIAQGAQNYAVNYVKSKQLDIANYKGLLADMEMNISAAALLLDNAVMLKNSGQNFTKQASEAKLFSSMVATKVTRDAIQLLGNRGYSKEHPLERFFRDAKLTEIGDGTSEIQRLIIADEVMKRESNKAR